MPAHTVLFNATAAARRAALSTAAFALVACGGAGRNDDLGYDPATMGLEQRDAQRVENGLPVRADGTPLRGVAVEGDWDTYRGNAERTGTRLAPGIQSPVVRWSAQVGIQGYANTPLVDDETVYVSSQGTTHNYADAEDGFYALDRSNGSQRWFYGTNEDVNGASLTDELVVGGTDDGTLYAIRRDDGTLAWTTELDHPIRHGPLVQGDTLLVNDRDAVTVLDVATGTIQMFLSAAEDGYGIRGALASNGTTVFRTSDWCSLESVDELNPWTQTLCAPDGDEWVLRDNFAPPSLLGDRLVVSAPAVLDYSSARITLSAVGLDGELLWTQPTETVHESLEMLRANIGYDQHHFAAVPWVMNGIAWLPQVSLPSAIGLDVGSGEPRAVMPLPDCRSRQFASIVGTPTRGYLARHDGILYGFAPSTGTVTWAISLRYNSSAGDPALQRFAGGLQVQDIYCSADPWDGSPLFATPAIGTDGTLYVGSGQGFLYAIDDVSW